MRPRYLAANPRPASDERGPRQTGGQQRQPGPTVDVASAPPCRGRAVRATPRAPPVPMAADAAIICRGQCRSVRASHPSASASLTEPPSTIPRRAIPAGDRSSAGSLPVPPQRSRCESSQSRTSSPTSTQIARHLHRNRPKHSDGDRQGSRTPLHHRGDHCGLPPLRVAAVVAQGHRHGPDRRMRPLTRQRAYAAATASNTTASHPATKDRSHGARQLPRNA